ncbi:MAG TPA: hypothetical protein PKO33_08435, partial [Pyrinomonadaceae bacterium]|nr:hypothetical protein [Pyrinomonadaceae bacterium]
WIFAPSRLCGNIGSLGQRSGFPAKTQGREVSMFKWFEADISQSVSGKMLRSDFSCPDTFGANLAIFYAIAARIPSASVLIPDQEYEICCERPITVAIDQTSKTTDGLTVSSSSPGILRIVQSELIRVIRGRAIQGCGPCLLNHLEPKSY